MRSSFQVRRTKVINPDSLALSNGSSDRSQSDEVETRNTGPNFLLVSDYVLVTGFSPDEWSTCLQLAGFFWSKVVCNFLALAQPNDIIHVIFGNPTSLYVLNYMVIDILVLPYSK